MNDFNSFEKQDEEELDRLIKKREELLLELQKLDEEITARAQLLRLAR